MKTNVRRDTVECVKDVWRRSLTFHSPNLFSSLAAGVTPRHWKSNIALVKPYRLVVVSDTLGWIGIGNGQLQALEMRRLCVYFLPWLSDCACDYWVAAAIHNIPSSIDNVDVCINKCCVQSLCLLPSTLIRYITVSRIALANSAHIFHCLLIPICWPVLQRLSSL